MGIKSAVKGILGEVNVFRLREWKNGIFPNEFSRREKEDMTRRIAFYSGFIAQGDLCFDVGANMGNRVAPMLAAGARVVAVEPQEFCQKVLRIKFGKKIEIVPMGLGPQDEVREMYISDANYLSSFSTTWIDSVKKQRFSQNSWNTVKKIQMTTLDKLVEKYGAPAFIKIDVEGFEIEVLSGLTRPAKLISCEYTVPEQTDRAIACIRRIQSFNPAIECNYSVGESMAFEMDKFIGVEDMIRLINTPEFIATGFGDIYIRQIS